MVRFGLQGFDELNAALGDLTERVQGKVVRESLADGAELVRRVAARRAPRDPKSGDHLADHIIVGKARQRRGSAVAIGPESKYFYGRFVEFGTVHMKPQPFMRPAFDENVQPILEQIKAAAWRELAARGVQRRATSTTVVTGPGRTV